MFMKSFFCLFVFAFKYLKKKNKKTRQLFSEISDYLTQVSQIYDRDSPKWNTIEGNTQSHLGENVYLREKALQQPYESSLINFKNMMLQKNKVCCSGTSC